MDDVSAFDVPCLFSKLLSSFASAVRLLRLNSDFVLFSHSMFLSFVARDTHVEDRRHPIPVVETMSALE